MLIYRAREADIKKQQEQNVSIKLGKHGLGECKQMLGDGPFRMALRIMWHDASLVKLAPTWKMRRMRIT
jgi:hypothetical protein